MEAILQQILSKLGDLEVNVANINRTMATKDELEEIKRTMATKDELEEIKRTMATKDELEEIKRTMATKDELEEIKRTMATKGELNELSLKLDRMESRLEMVYQQVVRNSELISMKADKEDIYVINKRLDIHLSRISKLEEDVALIKETIQ